MRTLVAIPTYNNHLSGYSIKDTLSGLVKQTCKDFKVLVVYKPSASDGTKEIVDSYRGMLDIEICLQDTGYFEEAMNSVFRVSKDYQLLLTLDDDAVPSSEWLAQHLALHQTFDKFGALGGRLVPTSRPFPIRHSILTRIVRQVIGYHRPLCNEFADYFVFINDMGLMNYPNPTLSTHFPSDIENWDEILSHFTFLPSIGFVGANSSFKTKYLNGFSLPEATIGGIGNEDVLATYIVKQGARTAIVNACTATHHDRESLARAKTDATLFRISLELAVLPYQVNYHQTINLRRLRAYRSILRSYATVKQALVFTASLKGLTISTRAISENWEPSKVRDAIKNCMVEFNQKHPSKTLA